MINHFFFLNESTNVQPDRFYNGVRSKSSEVLDVQYDTIDCLNFGQAHNHVRRTFLQTGIQKLEWQCHFNMHNMHIHIPSF